MQIEKKQFIKLYIWLFAGILLAVGVGLMKVGGVFDLHNPMNQERIYDVAGRELTDSSKTWKYDAQQGAFVLQTAKSAKSFVRIPGNKPWNYLKISLSNLSTATSEWKISYYDEEKKKLAEQVVSVGNGDNLIPIECTEAFRRMRIEISNQQGLFFSLDAVQFRMNTVGFSKGVFMDAFCMGIGVYLLISFLICLGRRIRGEDVLSVLQYAYKLPADYVGSRVTAKLSGRVVGYLQTILFMVLFLIAPVMNICGKYDDASFYRYGVLGCGIVLIFIALLAWEHPLYELKWHGVLTIAWFMLWGWVCISDLIVNKDVKFTGYIFLVAVGLFYYMWNNMTRPKQMMNRLIRGLEWTFPIVLVYTLICRKRYVGVLYNGAFSNRTDMSLYALAILIVFLAELYYVLKYQEVSHRRKRIVLYGISVSLAVYFLYRAYTLTCILAGVIVGIIFVLRVLRGCKRFPLGVSKTFGMLALTLVLSGAIVVGVNQLSMYLPDLLGTNVVYQNEELETNISAQEINEIEKMAPGYFDGVTHTTEKDRKLIWTNYLRKMNFFGNENESLRIGQSFELAGNGMLQMVYRYGIFILIPYILLLVTCLYTAWKRKGYLMFATTLAFGIVLLTQNIEQPFLHPLWILFYLGMGEWFVGKQRKKKEIE